MRERGERNREREREKRERERERNTHIFVPTYAMSVNRNEIKIILKPWWPIDGSIETASLISR